MTMGNLQPVSIDPFFLEICLSLSLYFLSLSLYSSSRYDKRHRPLNGNISYEGMNYKALDVIKIFGADKRMNVFQEVLADLKTPCILKERLLKKKIYSSNVMCFVKRLP